MGKRVLHVGCGGDPLPSWLAGYEEVRLDIDPSHKPHVVASMTDMGEVGEFDAVLSQHSLEHLFPHDVEQALAEFRRVLKPGGFACIIVPDAEGVTATEEVLFESPIGPITGMDLLYGYRPLLKAMPYMAHKTAFTAETLKRAMNKVFGKVETSRLENFNLLGIGVA